VRRVTESLHWRVSLISRLFLVLLLSFLYGAFFAAEFDAGFEVADCSAQSASAVAFGCYCASHLAYFLEKELLEGALGFLALETAKTVWR
jgi:hypothetical protein